MERGRLARGGIAAVQRIAAGRAGGTAGAGGEPPVHIRGVAGRGERARRPESLSTRMATTGGRAMTLAPAIEIDEATAARFAMYHMLTDALEFPTRPLRGALGG